MLAVPITKPWPPGVTFAVEWQPEPLQSRLPIGMWFPGQPAIVIVFEGGGPANGPVPGP
jgi:hypothetical protein